MESQRDRMRWKRNAERLAALSWAAFLALLASAYAIDLGSAALSRDPGRIGISRPSAR